MALEGLYVPLITPFTSADTVATDALERLAHDVLDGGAAGIVALGTTGEPAALTAGERSAVLEVCGRVCRERSATLIAGAGTNTTAASVAAVRELADRADYALVVVPYYTRPSEEGVVAHFEALAAASPVPVVIYNIPYRTGRPLSAATLLRLAAIPNVAGFKHTAGCVDEDTVHLMAGRPDGCAVLAGDDLFIAPLLSLGASGAIAASAHLRTAEFAALIAGDRSRWPELARFSAPFFAEPNPAVMKAVLHAAGRIPTPDVRLPLLPAGESSLSAALRVSEGSPRVPVRA